jgi:aspartyl-tRNA synthetase
MFDFRRSCKCNELRKTDVGKTVTLSGWVNRRRDHGGLIFIDLRDRFGLTQLVFDPKINSESHKIAADLRAEWCISIKGKVTYRGEGLTNPNLPTGDIEIRVEELAILSVSKTPPFSVCDETIDVNEELRLKYRYLDIRRGDIAKKLEMRHKLMLAVRNHMDKEGFLEISTPILSKSTPEGARDYLVPSRIYPGTFYALPQSPQIYKQILMISGMDRYFQIAECFRDEDLRADRQPEFTQIDIEMSFATPEELFHIAEELIKTIFKSCLNVQIPTPFPRMTYKEAIESYGSDKPDLRFEMKLHRLDMLAQKITFPPFQDTLKMGGCIKAIVIPKGADFSRKQLEGYEAQLKNLGLSNLYYMKKTPEAYTTGISKYFTQENIKELETIHTINAGDLILFACDKESIVNLALDQLRRQLGKEMHLIDEKEFNFRWVVDFPLFSIDKETNELTSEHHAFTSPHFDDMHLIDKDPLKMRAFAYDLVCNGYEIASGSQRIHDSALQKKIFEIIKLTEEDIKKKFGFFIEALSYGTPPHLGMALGLDRLTMIITKTDNIRDVIAFPKTQKASDLMSQSPSEVSLKQLQELQLKINR